MNRSHVPTLAAIVGLVAMFAALLVVILTRQP
jgi:hypothetical protein